MKTLIRFFLVAIIYCQFGITLEAQPPYHIIELDITSPIFNGIPVGNF